MARKKQIHGTLSAFINDFIKENYDKGTDNEIAIALNESVAMQEAGIQVDSAVVKKRRYYLKLEKPQHNQYDKIKSTIKPSKVKLSAINKKYESRVVRSAVRSSSFRVSNLLNNIALKEWLNENIIRLLGHKRQHASMDTLIKRLRTDFKKTDFKNEVDEIKRSDIFSILDALYWKPKGRTQIVHDAVNIGYNAQKLKHILDENTPGLNIPLWVVEEKLRAVKGYTHAPRAEIENPKGILRLDITKSNLERIPLPSSYNKPLSIETDKTGNAKIAIMSGPQMGLPYDVAMERNLIRCGFSTARKEKCTHMIIGGGLMRFVLKQASGPLKILRDLITATELNPESFSTLYREDAEKLLKGNKLEPIFATATEMFEDLLRGWYRVTVRTSPDNGGGERPEFNGAIYIVLGPEDLQIVARIAYFYLLYEMKKQQAKARAKMKLWSSVVKSTEEALNSAERAGDADLIESTTRVLTSAQLEYDKACDKDNRTKVTNMLPQQDKKAFKSALAYFIQRIEDVIPNSRVVGIGEMYMKFGQNGNIVRFLCADTGNPFNMVVDNIGPMQRSKQLAKQTYIMNSSAPYFRSVGRENYHDGKMLGTVHFYEVPLLIDRERILRSSYGLRIPDKVMKAVNNSAQQSGMLVLNYTKSLGLENPYFFGTDTLRARGQSGASKQPVEYIWKCIMTDQHVASMNRVRIITPEGIPIGIPDAVMRMLQKSGIDRNGTVPFATFEALDDQIQGEHFGNFKRPHPEAISIPILLKKAEEVLKFSERNPRKKKALELLQHEVIRLSNQLWVRPPNNITMQWPELIQGFIEPNADIFACILRRAKCANIRIYGAGHFRGQEYNMQDPGIIVFGSGNHMAKTLDLMLHEGPLLADRLIAELGKFNEWSVKELRNLVKGPLSQDQTIAYGVLIDAKEYRWGLEYASSPAKRSGWTDILSGSVVKNKKVGNPSTFLGAPIDYTVHEYGDKHFCASTITNDGIIVMGPSSTHTDSFAWTAGGLPENNNGVAFLGLPVGGPKIGSIRYEHMTADVIQDYIGNNKPFPWLDLLVNPAGGWKS